MRIALDCMGGDHPAVGRNVRGAMESLAGPEIGIVLVGRKREIQSELSELRAPEDKFEIVHADETVGMDESPASALRRKRGSSLWTVFRLIKEGKADGAITAGNTGAAMAMAKAQLGMLPFVEKPAIAVPLPTPAGVVTLLDAGANVDCKPKHLFQFALMGDIYSRNVCRVAAPRIGVLSIGEEESKGNELTKGVYGLLKESPVSFAGNVEGKDIFSGKADVIVCDGFVGNIVLKVTEAFAEILENLLLVELKKGLAGRLGGLLMKKSYKAFKKKITSSAYGGAPLLGINGVCIISHGSSSPAAIKSAVFTARDFINADLNRTMEKALESGGEKAGVQEGGKSF